MTDLKITLVADLILTGIALIYVFACVLIPEILQKRGIVSKFVARKTVHLLTGLAIFITPYLSIPWFAVALAASMVVVTYRSSKNSSNPMLRDLYNSIGEEAEEQKGYLQGPFHYTLAITILIAIFSVVFQVGGWSLFYVPIAGILIMIISDSLAAIAGKRWGRHELHVPWIHSKRTLEGSLAFFISGFALTLFSFFMFGVWLPGNSVHLMPLNAFILSIIMTGMGTVIEGISPSTWDDLTIPLATTAIISALAFGGGLIVLL